LRLLSALGVSAALHAVLAVSLGHLPAIATDSIEPPASLTVTLAAVAPRHTIPENEVQGAVTSGNAVQVAAAKQVERESQAAAPMPQRTSALALPPAKYYFKSREVDVPAEAINDVLLRYPQSAFAQAISGEVRLRVLINDQGGVDKVEIVNTSPQNVFDSAAVAAAIQLRYRPALKDGRAVPSQKTVAIVFDPSAAPLD
jgi:TonB family protein